MALVLEGTNRRILMPDGRYLTGEVSGIGSWIWLHDNIAMATGGGYSSTAGQAAYTAFPRSFTTVFDVLICEGGAGGWTDAGGGPGGFGTVHGLYYFTTSGFYSRNASLGGNTVVVDNAGYGFRYMAFGTLER
jgi:hypothetical protein